MSGRQYSTDQDGWKEKVKIKSLYYLKTETVKILKIIMLKT